MRSCATATTPSTSSASPAALTDFMNVELSAFYFDIRKDALYCDAPSSLKRRAALQIVRKLFDCLVLVAGADAALHHGGGLADRASGRRRFGPSRAVPAISPADWRERGAGREVGEDPHACAASSPARWKSSARKSASARRWRPLPSCMSPIRELLRGAGRTRLRRNLHHQRDHGRGERRPGGCLPHRGRRRRGGRAEPAAGHANAPAPGVSCPMSAPIRNFPNSRCAMRRQSVKSMRQVADFTIAC